MAMAPAASTVRIFRVALPIHLAIVAAISVLAYTGRLPVGLLRVDHLDLAGHAVLLGTLALLLDGALAFRPAPLLGTRWIGIGPLIVLSVAALEEALQSLSPGRTASVYDFLADVAGAVAICTLARVVMSISKARGT